MRLLGPPVLESDTGAWPFPCERPYQLLAYLAACGDWVDRDRLAALFWPEQGNAEARRNLRRILHAAAHVGAPVALERRGDLLRWQVPTDLALFEAALREGRHPDALALVRGPFADGMDTPACEGFDRWLAAERQRFGSRVQAARAMLPAAREPRSAAGALQPDREPGHERELEALSAWWAAGAGCAGGVGPAGVGKTRLACELAARVGCPSARLDLAAVAPHAARIAQALRAMQPGTAGSRALLLVVQAGAAPDPDAAIPLLALDAWAVIVTSRTRLALPFTVTIELAGLADARRDTFERSWQLVAPRDREAWVRLSVIAGGFPLDAARAIAGATLATIANLVDASLLEVTRHDGASRFAMPPGLRELARDRLREQPQWQREATTRHARYYAARLDNGRNLALAARVDDLVNRLCAAA